MAEGWREWDEGKEMERVVEGNMGKDGFDRVEERLSREKERNVSKTVVAWLKE